MKISQKKLFSLLLSLAVLLVLYFFPESPANSVIVSDTSFYDIVKVADGDTITVLIDGERVGVRLIGLNTPETVDPRVKVQCFGREASDQAKKLLTGQKVRLEADSTQGDKDKYGRLLRYVFMTDGTLFNKWMIENGFGFEYTYDSNPYEYQLEFKAAQDSARDNGRGLWAPEACGGELKSN